MLDTYLEEKKPHGSPGLPIEVCYEPEPGTNLDVPIHWHKGFEVIHFTGGPALFNVNFHEFTAHDGDLIIIPGQALHGVTALSETISYCRTVIFDLSLLESIMMDDGTLGYITPIISHTIETIHQIRPNSPGYKSLLDLCQDLIVLMAERPMAYELLLKSKLLTFIAHLYTCHYIRVTKTNHYNPPHLAALRQVLTYIQTHYNSHITTHTLSAIAGFSDDHFIRLFKQYIHQTPNQYLLQFRLDIACKELKSADKSITEVAYDVGFNNVSYFIRRFKERYQVSPQKYRQGLQ